MTLTFRNDQPDDFLGILREAGQWMTDNNQEMWQLDTLTADNLFDEYTHDNCYTMYADNVAVDTFVLQWKGVSGTCQAQE